MSDLRKDKIIDSKDKIKIVEFNWEQLLMKKKQRCPFTPLNY
jgi:hypothetical protein